MNLKRLSVLMFSVLIIMSSALQGQSLIQPPAETAEAMQWVAILAGTWTGSGWIQMGPARHEFTQTESISLKANSTVVQIEGLGLSKEDPEQIVHQAYAAISYDAVQKKYLMVAYRGDGVRIDADFQMVDDSTMQWGFAHPMAGQIRFTISIVDDTWIEHGEMSREGVQWTRFIEMRLQKAGE
jgi:hypothetical protein